jgi:hypothetical protein
MNFLPGEKYGLPSRNFVKNRNVLCEKGDEITRFDSTLLLIVFRRFSPVLKGGERVVDYSSSIPAALNWIAEAENHPSPEECGGIDYASIYR